MGRIRDLVPRYVRAVRSSIAFYPTVIALAFTAASFLVVRLQTTGVGETLVEALPFLDFRDANTARAILAALVGGVMSLTVFSFSMVMIVLSRAASNLSPRILDRLVGEPAYQYVLGVYVGTTVYCLLLLINVERSEDATGQIPSVGVVVGVAAGVLCIALFVYFIHHIAEGVKPSSIIRRIHLETADALEAADRRDHVGRKDTERALGGIAWTRYRSSGSGYFQGVRTDVVHRLAEAGAILALDRRLGEYVLEGTWLFRLSQDAPELAKTLEDGFWFYEGENVEANWYSGFRQLSEIAVKALSPGINDPGTAVLALNALTPLLADLLTHGPDRSLADSNGNLRVLLRPYEAEHVARVCVAPIRHYGRGDVTVLGALLGMLHQLGQLETVRRSHEALLLATATSVIHEADESLSNPGDRAHVNARIREIRSLGTFPATLPMLDHATTI